MIGEWYDFLLPAMPALRETAAAAADLTAASASSAAASAAARAKAEVEAAAEKKSYEGAFTGAALVVGAGLLLWLMLRR